MTRYSKTHEQPKIVKAKRSVVRKLHNLIVMGNPQLFAPNEPAAAFNNVKL